jgi:hypothetical protein
MSPDRVPHPLPLLDAATAEHLLRGGPIEQLPDEYRQLGQLLMATRAAALPNELEGSAAAAASFIAAHDAIRPAPLRRPRSLRAPALPRRLEGSAAGADPFVAAHDATRPAPRRRPRSLAAMVVVGVLMAASTGSAVAATHGSLPEPVQQVAHEALGVVGISVPGIEPTRDLRDTVDPAVSSVQTTSSTGSDAPAAPGSGSGDSHVVTPPGRSAGDRPAGTTGSGTTVSGGQTATTPADPTIPDGEDPKVEDPVSGNPAPADPSAPTPNDNVPNGKGNGKGLLSQLGSAASDQTN